MIQNPLRYLKHTIILDLKIFSKASIINLIFLRPTQENISALRGSKLKINVFKILQNYSKEN